MGIIINSMETSRHFIPSSPDSIRLLGNSWREFPYENSCRRSLRYFTKMRPFSAGIMCTLHFLGELPATWWNCSAKSTVGTRSTRTRRPNVGTSEFFGMTNSPIFISALWDCHGIQPGARRGGTCTQCAGRRTDTFSTAYWYVGSVYS